MWRRSDSKTDPTSKQPINDTLLTALGSQIYDYNVDTIRAIQQGEVGWLVAESRHLPRREMTTR